MKQETIDRIRKFTADREWEQYHTPGNLAKSISIEANELFTYPIPIFRPAALSATTIRSAHAIRRLLLCILPYGNAGIKRCFDYEIVDYNRRPGSKGETL